MGEWKNGLFGCFGNFGLCIVTYFVPCLTAGKNAEAVGESCFLYGCLSTLGPIGIWSRAKIRGMIREQKGIEVLKFFTKIFHVSRIISPRSYQGMQIMFSVFKSYYSN